jgi:bacillithiol biosynthesis deacetylase BshB1
MELKADLLVFSAHPDDAELACGGTLAKMVAEGKKVVVADLTQGEMGTRGSPESRKAEAAESAQILGLADRIQLYLPDTEFSTSRKDQLPLIQTIRRFRPEIVFCNAPQDRHPDHGRSAKLESDACFYAGLAKIETSWDGQIQAAWRPKLVFHYIQDKWIKPDFVIDISGYWEKKVNAIKAFKTQFYDPNSTEPETYISTQVFWDFLEARAREMGHLIEVSHGEGFVAGRSLGLSSVFDLV